MCSYKNTKSARYKIRPSHKELKKNQKQFVKMNRQKPLCALCRNHGKKHQIKGHKVECQYNECICKECIIIKESRRASRVKIRLRRRQSFQEELKGKQDEQTLMSPRQDITEMKHMEPEKLSVANAIQHYPTIFSPAPTYFQPPGFDYRGYNQFPTNLAPPFIPPIIDFGYGCPVDFNDNNVTKREDNSYSATH